ncbi:MAG: hypothetical protein ACTSRG_25760 [Candidatus Helarchaeota archaeon]
MNLDVDTLIDEGIDVKNEMHSIFKDLEDAYDDIADNYKKMEKPLKKIIENFKDFAKETAEIQTESPVFELAKKYEGLLDAQQKLVTNLNNDVVLTLKQIIMKSELLNDNIKELNSFSKNARKLKEKINKLEEDITKLHAKGKTDKIPSKETEKSGKESEYKVAKDKLIGSKNRFDEIWKDFHQEMNELLKKALEKSAEANKAYGDALKDVADEESNTAGKL